jgi:hypothetical protein
MLATANKVFSQEQKYRFGKEIEQFEEIDRAEGFQPEAVLFVGSSSIRRWSTLAQDMAPMPVINRGFGGSTLPEVLHYADRIITPHNPKIIVLYCGENDLANNSTTANDVLESFKQMNYWLQKNLPDARLYFISIKPSVKRWKYWKKMNEANLLILQYMSRHSHLRFIDVSTPMLDSKGRVKGKIFVEDNLHLNDKGYKIWTKAVKSAIEGTYNILFPKK